MIRIPYEELHTHLVRVLVKEGFEPERAHLCARLIADSSRDGVYSHGLNRFPRFIETIRKGLVDVRARPERVASFGAFERWDGKAGAGNLNAYQCMDRAIALSRKHATGCVALANTNHWMRGGSYGWQAVEEGALAICWSNTMPNMPPWGATDPRLGNNPLVIAMPRTAGHVVLDMAMSQFSLGALQSYRTREEQLPVDGGYTQSGELTRNAEEIEASGRVLPIGYWKGSGLALMLDLLAAVLSGGRATYQIPPNPSEEAGLSQVFMAFDLKAIEKTEVADRVVNQIIEYLQGDPSLGQQTVRYPGERTMESRRRNLQEGILVEEEIWQFVKGL
jgi:3-dehydro-L-gulonate 2-dehydrogenase